MQKFAIKNAYYDGKTVGYLYYDEQSREYEIEIPETVKSYEAPLIISDFIEKTSTGSEKNGVTDGFARELLRRKDRILDRF